MSSVMRPLCQFAESTYSLGNKLFGLIFVGVCVIFPWFLLPSLVLRGGGGGYKVLGSDSSGVWIGVSTGGAW